jgi:hypothetical protein
MSGQMPDRLPEKCQINVRTYAGMSENMSDKTHGSISHGIPDKKCQNICQVECQNICRTQCTIECQIQSQIDRLKCQIECQNVFYVR